MLINPNHPLPCSEKPYADLSLVLIFFPVTMKTSKKAGSEKKKRDRRAEYMRIYRARKAEDNGQVEHERRGRKPKTQRPTTQCHRSDGIGALDWIESRLKVPSGPLRGRPFILDAWQRNFLGDCLASTDGGPLYRESGLSVARKNGKSGLIAAFFLAYLVGPLNFPYFRGIVTSLTGALAKELRGAIESIAKVSELDEMIHIYRSPAPGRIVGREDSEVSFLAADKATGHALGADLAVIDEAGLLDEKARDLWQACKTSVGGRNGRFVCISIQGDGPMFGEMKKRKGEPGVCFHEFAAVEGCSLDDEVEWHKANPGLRSGIKSMSYMRDTARAAKVIEADQNSFRTLDLNCPGGLTRETIISVANYKAAIVSEGEPEPSRSGPCTLGLDLGGSASMSAAACFWSETGRLEASGAFPGIPDLRARSEADGVGRLYELMSNGGELRIYPEVRVTPVKEFLIDVLNGLRGVDLDCVVADRFRESEAKDLFDSIDADPDNEDVDCGFERVFRGLGFNKESCQNIIDCQRAFIGGKVKLLKPSLLLASAIKESSVIRDPSGNLKLDKGRRRGRIDVLQAVVLAVGEGTRRAERGPSKVSFCRIPLDVD